MQQISDQERNEPEPSRGGGVAVVLWVLASLIVEVEVLWWVFSRMYGS
jgi:hypothetical protein